MRSSSSRRQVGPMEQVSGFVGDRLTGAQLALAPDGAFLALASGSTALGVNLFNQGFLAVGTASLIRGDLPEPGLGEPPTDGISGGAPIGNGAAARRGDRRRHLGRRRNRRSHARPGSLVGGGISGLAAEAFRDLAAEAFPKWASGQKRRATSGAWRRYCSRDRGPGRPRRPRERSACCRSGGRPQQTIVVRAAAEPAEQRRQPMIARRRLEFRAQTGSFTCPRALRRRACSARSPRPRSAWCARTGSIRRDHDAMPGLDHEQPVALLDVAAGEEFLGPSGAERIAGLAQLELSHA